MSITQLAAVTRRLQGRYFVTIDDVTGVPGQAPAIVITRNDLKSWPDFWYYDNSREREAAISEARHFAECHFKTYDVIDNTL